MYFDNYNPLNFVKAHARWGTRLAPFLSDPVILARLDAAVEMRKTAAQSIATPLLEKFGRETREFRFRQLVGHMLCHLMKQRGCEIDQPDVRISDGVVFTRAARYRKSRPELNAAR